MKTLLMLAAGLCATAAVATPLDAKTHAEITGESSVRECMTKARANPIYDAVDTVPLRNYCECAVDCTASLLNQEDVLEIARTHDYRKITNLMNAASTFCYESSIVKRVPWDRSRSVAPPGATSKQASRAKQGVTSF